MSRKLPRLVLVAFVVVGLGLAPMFAAQAGSSGIDVSGTQFGTGSLNIYRNDTVTWYIKDGTHTVTPDDNHAGGQEWTEKPSGRLDSGSQFTASHFEKAGEYYYFCEIHKTEGMTGVINVIDPSATTTTTAPPTTTTTAPPTTTTTAPTTTTTTAPPTTTTTAPPTTTTTAPPTTTTAPLVSSVGAHTPSTAAPATTTTSKAGADKKAKDETTTTTTAPAPPLLDLPDSAIVPTLPGSEATATTVQDGVEATADPLEGEAVALLNSKGNGGKAVKLLIVSGIAIGALGVGSAGYKFARRSSKYFPA